MKKYPVISKMTPEQKIRILPGSGQGRQLLCYGKTRLLQPGECEEVVLEARTLDFRKSPVRNNKIV